MFFKCKHHFADLIVAKEATVVKVDEDFEHVTYHFSCAKCGERLTKTYARTIGGVEEFMKRGRNDH